MKTKFMLSMMILICCSSLGAQEFNSDGISKRENRKNLTIKEWNTNARSKTRWMDHYTIYDEQGRKIEEAEFTNYGQKQRIVLKYAENGVINEEIVYDDRNKVSRVRKYEYNSNGSKKKQYNYLPNGKLYSIKIFEYQLSEKK